MFEEKKDNNNTQTLEYSILRQQQVTDKEILMLLPYCFKNNFKKGKLDSQAENCLVKKINGLKYLKNLNQLIMQETNKQEDKENQYTIKDMLLSENAQAFSGFGKMLKSEKQTMPRTKFGTASRNQMEKVFCNKEMCKTQFMGKQSPGPAYYPSMKQVQERKPHCTFGKSQRNSENNNQKYSYYSQIDQNFNAHQADLQRRKQHKGTRFSKAQRFSTNNNTQQQTPGPIYESVDPSKVKYQNGPKFTIGYKRIPKKNHLMKPTCTPDVVGPSNYRPKDDYLSKNQKNPQYSFPKQQKLPTSKQYDYNHQTYEIYRSIGKQLRSQKKTSSNTKFGKASRNTSAGVSHKDLSYQPAKLRLVHAYY